MSRLPPRSTRTDTPFPTRRSSDLRIPGVRFVEAATPGEEAQAIALALRRALDTPEQTAALVTPDRGLARRVAAHLKRWGIAIDDSAGQTGSASCRDRVCQYA